ncbi:hypothetical protein Cgig2_013554 [Carnegiea gigantea]|uniref:Uncharacterized protein n=1 Tax=Carnegiea gigantea TaxID=171969 RepID=A0A9Q1GVL7_9CARY|nr:hypothetical protein Cgig2_013554 [Carnegiea gigantea]
MADGEEEEEKMGTSFNEFDLPDEILGVLPSDPFTQLDIARKITSIALSTRVSALESEASVLRAQLTDRDNIIADLQSQIESLDASLADSLDRLARAEQEKENLLQENSSLSSTVNKLRRDVAKAKHETLKQWGKEVITNLPATPLEVTPAYSLQLLLQAVNFNFGHKEHFMYSAAAGKVQPEERPSKWQDKKVMVQRSTPLASSVEGELVSHTSKASGGQIL